LPDLLNRLATTPAPDDTLDLATVRTLDGRARACLQTADWDTLD